MSAHLQIAETEREVTALHSLRPTPFLQHGGDDVVDNVVVVVDDDDDDNNYDDVVLLKLMIKQEIFGQTLLLSAE